MTDSLRGPGPVHGFWSTTASSSVIEIACVDRPDFLCFDAQHGRGLDQLTTTMFSALAGSGVKGMVRVAVNDPSEIGRALDLGASGVMVPMVNNAAEAQRAVRAFKSAPDGDRSFGMQTPRIDALSVGYRPICAIQIETAEALSNVDAIAGVEGIDWLYIGPADLGLSIGGVSGSDVQAVFNGSHSLANELTESFTAVVSACQSNGVLPGLHCSSGDATRVAQDHGFRVASVATDASEMRAGMSRQLKQARQ